MAPDRGTPDEEPTITLPTTMPPTDPSSEAESPTTTPSTPPHLSHDPANNTKRSDPFQFGQRFLTSTSDVFAFNAWDHVLPDPDHDTYALAQYEKQRSTPVSAFDKARFNTNPEKWWDLFYKQKTSTFFKDRKWLVQEFPVLHEVTREGVGPRVILEVGAGAGNTAFPILRLNENAELKVHAYDFSKRAVETMRESESYDERFVRAEVWDVASDELAPGLGENSVDIVIMIFVFSALSPSQWAQAVRNVYRMLKPSGEVLFRDYGRGDLAQVRFKSGRWMEENFYVRGDGTRVYFFEVDELKRIWGEKATEGEDESTNGHDDEAKRTSASTSDDNRVNENSESTNEQSHMSRHPEDITQHQENEETNLDSTTVSSSQPFLSIATPAQHPKFNIMNLDVDRRLLVNRQRQLKMYRCWIQGRFQKTPQIQSS